MSKPALETNGMANIITLVDVFEVIHQYNTASDKAIEELFNKIRGQALLTIKYMKAREGDSPKQWHEMEEGE